MEITIHDNDKNIDVTFLFENGVILRSNKKGLPYILNYKEKAIFKYRIHQILKDGSFLD